MEFTNDGLEVPVDESMNLLRTFGFVAKDMARTFGPEHPETIEFFSLLSPMVEVVSMGEDERLKVPHEDLARMAKLSGMLLKLDSAEQPFAPSEYDPEMQLELRTKAFNALTSLVEIGNEMRVKARKLTTSLHSGEVNKELL